MKMTSHDPTFTTIDPTYRGILKIDDFTCHYTTMCKDFDSVWKPTSIQKYGDDRITIEFEKNLHH